MVLAGEGPIDQLTDGACFAQVIQKDHQGHITDPRFPIYLVGQVGKIQLQVLEEGTGLGQQQRVGIISTSPLVVWFDWFVWVSPGIVQLGLGSDWKHLYVYL